MRRRSEDLTDDVVVTSKKRCSDASDDRTTVEKRGLYRRVVHQCAGDIRPTTLHAVPF